MNLPPIFANVITVLLLGLVTVTALAAVFVLIRAVRSTRGGESIPGHAPQLVLFAFVLALFSAAVAGVGKAYELVVEGWPAILGVVVGLFGGWLTYRAATKIATTKAGNVDLGASGGTP